MSAFSRFFLGSPSRAQQLPTMTPEQQNLLNSLLGQLGGPLSSGIQNLQNILSGSPEAFSAYERPAMRQFQEEIIPGISERFAGAGAGSSGGFQQTLGRAGERLAESLAAQRAGLQSQALSQLQNLLGLGTQSQFQYSQIPGSTGFLGALAPGLGAGLGMGLGGGIPSLFGKLFGGGKSATPQTPASPYGPGATYNPYTGMQGGVTIG